MSVRAEKLKAFEGREYFSYNYERYSRSITVNRAYPVSTQDHYR